MTPEGSKLLQATSYHPRPPLVWERDHPCPCWSCDTSEVTVLWGRTSAGVIVSKWE